jgi:hypothetical protein
LDVNSRTRIALLGAALGLVAATAHAGSFGDASGSGAFYSPRVPISALARPAAWFDPSRLHVSTSVTVGSGFGGGTSALQRTSFHYDFGMPLSLNVSVGNAWGPGTARGNSFFLEGLDVGYRPFQSMLIRVQYRDVRSPLQYTDGFRSPYGSPIYWGD